MRLASANPPPSMPGTKIKKEKRLFQEKKNNNKYIYIYLTSFFFGGQGGKIGKDW